ncbi:MAG: SDR family NAD(P)-dependent oxidoreductase [Sphingomonadales bacterium]|nr:SDR family NAD(P)-dependent oxidoreductase [Sphingomonadales bacterium]
MAQRQKVAVVTGASSGIGKETAKALVAQGWHVIAHGRDAARSEAARAEIAGAVENGGKVDMVRADLSLLSDTARMADEIAGLTGHVDALLANAGGVRDAQVVTAEGNEVTFAGNHLGHFLLVRNLLPLLRAAAPSRIVSTSSRAHMLPQAINWDDLQGLENWTSVGAYGVAKLANVLFTRELARRLAGDVIVAHAMHPGVVASNFASHGNADMQQHMAAAETISPAQAADTLIWLASAEEPAASTGLYWHERQPAEVSPLAQDDAAAARLWAESEALLAKAGY